MFHFLLCNREKLCHLYKSDYSHIKNLWQSTNAQWVWHALLLSAVYTPSGFAARQNTLVGNVKNDKIISYALMNNWHPCWMVLYKYRMHSVENVIHSLASALWRPLWTLKSGILAKSEVRRVFKRDSSSVNTAKQHMGVQVTAHHEFHETCHSITFYFMKKDSERCCDTSTPESIHTKDESKRGSAFAFIFGVNWPVQWM